MALNDILKFSERLKSSTENFKRNFIESQVEWADSNFMVCENKTKYTDADWCKIFGVEPVVKNYGGVNHLCIPDKVYWSEIGKYIRKEKENAWFVKRMGLEKYLEYVRKNSEDYYNHSMDNAAERILRKGICPDPFEFKIVSVTRNVGIDLTISDGKKTVRLYTIVAEGEIQKKHFRLLIK